MNRSLDFSICSAFFGNRTFVFLHGKDENLEISSKFTEIEQTQNIVLYSLGYSRAFFSDFKESAIKTLKTSKTAQINNQNFDLHEELIKESRLLQSSKTSELSFHTARDAFGSEIRKNDEQVKKKSEILKSQRSEEIKNNEESSKILKSVKNSEILKTSKTEERKNNEEIKNNEEASKILKSSKISEVSHKKSDDQIKNPSELLKSSKNNEESSKILKSSKTSEISQKKSDEQIKIPSQILKSSKTEEYSKILRSSKISQKNEPPLVRSVVSVEKDENSGSALKKSEFLDRKSSKQAEMKEKEENLKLSGIERNEENKEGKSIKISQNSDSDRRNEENKESFIRETIKKSGDAFVLKKSLKKSEVLSICQNFNCQKKGETFNFINSRCGHCFCSDCLQALFLEGKPTRCPKNLCFEKLDVGRAQAFLEGKEEEFEFE